MTTAHRSIDEGFSSVTAPDEPWVDTKRRWWLLGLIVPTLPVLAWAAGTLSGISLGWWLGPFLVVVVIPGVDALLGEDRSNPPESAVEQLSADRFYRWCTYLYLPLQYAGLAFACWVVATGDLGWFEWLGYALSVGTVAGIAINTAHELGHKATKSERRLARIALAQSGYGHFYIEHNRGHHKRVATPEDPASSRLGESFWEFLPRTVIGSLRSAWELECNGLAHRSQRVLSRHNGVLMGWLGTAGLFAVLTAAFGWSVLGFLVVQAVVGFSLLEIVNYIEHYGLLRQVDERGRYERCRPEHSWNSNHIGSNLVLYQLERHSDHHAHPTRRFQALRHFEEAPQFPNGYGGMIALAAIPPLWRRVMDHRVVELYDGDVTRANLHPRNRDATVARYRS